MPNSSSCKPLKGRLQRGREMAAALSANRLQLHYCALSLFAISLAACAAPYVHPPTADNFEPSLNATHAVMEDGYRLPLMQWPAEDNPRAVVLALHGMNDYSNSFESTGRYLATHSITVIAYDQRGFGATQGRGLWHGSKRLVWDLRVMVRLLRERYPDRPLYLLGESMGGAVVLASLSSDAPDIAGIILVAPAIWSRRSMPYYQRALLWLAAHTVPAKHLTGEGLDLKPSDNIEMLRALGRDPLVIKSTRVDVLYGVSNLMDDAQRASSQLNGDALILYGKNDEIIPKRPTCQWLQNLPSEASQRTHTLIYVNGYHMLTRDLQAEAVLHDIAGWIAISGNGAPEKKNSDETMQVKSFCVH